MMTHQVRSQAPVPALIVFSRPTESTSNRNDRRALRQRNTTTWSSREHRAKAHHAAEQYGRSFGTQGQEDLKARLSQQRDWVLLTRVVTCARPNGRELTRREARAGRRRVNPTCTSRRREADVGGTQRRRCRQEVTVRIRWMVRWRSSSRSAPWFRVSSAARTRPWP
jgi:hypothetical protein